VELQAKQAAAAKHMATLVDRSMESANVL
jgi:hypothetical protein